METHKIKAIPIDLIEISEAINIVNKAINDDLKMLGIKSTPHAPSNLANIMLLRDHPESIFSKIGLDVVAPPNYHQNIAARILNYRLSVLKEVGT